MLDEEEGQQNQMMSEESGRTSSPPKEDRTEAASHNKAFLRSKWVFTVILMLLGGVASAAFLVIGIRSTQKDSKAKFEREAEEFSSKVQATWNDYEIFSLWIHGSCFKTFTPNPAADDVADRLGICSRQQFRRLYEHVAATGLDIFAAEFLPNVTHDLRDELENESRLYMQEWFPDFDYQGIRERPPGMPPALRAEQPFYFPVHYVEPREVKTPGFLSAIDLDAYVSQRESVDKAVNTWKPVLSKRLQLDFNDPPGAYAIILQHPGIPPTDENATRPTALSQILIRLPTYLDRATVGVTINKALYMYDSTDTPQKPVFLGAIDVRRGHQGVMQREPLPEVELVDISRTSSTHFFTSEVSIADRRWTVVVTSDEYQANLVYIIAGGTVVITSVLLMAIWFYSHLSRVARINQMRSEAQVQTARHARDQAVRERQLNEFMAHEVRNPLSSAMSALSFIKSAVLEPNYTKTTQKAILEDISIMNASLQFINELLRNMLDVHRTTDKQMKLDFGPTDVGRDVLQPVASILFMRGAKVDIKTDCPDDLFVKSDRMRLKQIILNLASNATKFVQVGFIRLRAANVKGSVELSVEDSGPGIPPSKRQRLFARFQESLDSLNQGTGLGLSVCKNLSDLLGADIYLDENFDSGIPGSPGTRFCATFESAGLGLGQHESEPERIDGRTAGSDGAAARHKCTTRVVVSFVCGRRHCASQNVYSCRATGSSDMEHRRGFQWGNGSAHGRCSAVRCHFHGPIHGQR